MCLSFAPVMQQGAQLPPCSCPAAVVPVGANQIGSANPAELPAEEGLWPSDGQTNAIKTYQVAKLSKGITW